MDFIYPFFIAFILIFLSELGDKTQLLVLSFSTKTKCIFILLGVALGSFFSHGIAILFGSTLGSFENEFMHSMLQLVTYFSFLLFGIVGLFQRETESDSNTKSNLIKKVAKISSNYILIVAFSIAIGELGDKTFLASLGLGIQYSGAKFALVLGCILGMVLSDSIAIVLGKLLQKKISNNTMNFLSNILFLLFGIIGLVGFFVKVVV